MDSLHGLEWRIITSADDGSAVFYSLSDKRGTRYRNHAMALEAYVDSEQGAVSWEYIHQKGLIRVL